MLPPVGTMIKIKQMCNDCGEEGVWNSQDTAAETNLPVGNIKLSAAMLATGAVVTPTLRTLKVWGLQCYTPQTYFDHQRKYLHQVSILCSQNKRKQAHSFCMY